jgi:hypothetical protein
MKQLVSSNILLIVVGSLFMPGDASANSNAVLPDLALQFVCKDKTRSGLELDIETFLRNEGFKVLNLGRIQREHDLFLLDVHIVAVDGARRIVDIISIPPAEARYGLRLTSPPPTRHAPQLEEAFKMFISEKINCEIRQESRSENEADAKKLFDSAVRRIENLFDEAERLQGERRL